ncbi:rCG37431 [Rattus norvegicus]|uniref:RCG37431 n=1 Tax=Rattus norvegicus TaxID=10116 RepID=A6KHY1_RAT|nr:rCG37431 [Rattus norvegicus]
MLHIILPPVISDPNDFQYYLTTTEFTEGAILMRVELVTPCGPHQRPPRSEHVVLPPLPGLSQNSMADFAFWLEIYNDILACLYTSQEIFIEPQDSSQLLCKGVFSSGSQKQQLQVTPHGAVVTLGSYPTIMEKQGEYLKALLLAVLKRWFLPHHNKWLREHSLPLANIKGISFSHAQMDFSEDYILLTVPE